MRSKTPNHHHNKVDIGAKDANKETEERTEMAQEEEETVAIRIARKEKEQKDVKASSRESVTVFVMSYSNWTTQQKGTEKQ